MLITLLAAVAATAQPQPLRKFDDWLVGCDNVLSCRSAVGFLEGGVESDFYGFSVSRDGDPAALPKIKLNVDGIVAAISDDKRVPLHFDDNHEGEDHAGENHELSAGDVGPLLQLITTAQKLEFVDAAGEVVVAIPLKGSIAALRWMDERQQRVGTITALVAKGSQPASSVPTPPPLPTIMLPAPSTKTPVKLARAQVSEILKSWSCSARHPDSVEYHRLDAATTLAILPCWRGRYKHGGYENVIAILVSNERRYRAAPFEFPDPDDTNNMAEPYFDASKFSLSVSYMDYMEAIFSTKAVSSKEENLIDCGSIKEHVWDGYRFRLSYYTNLDDCYSGRHHFITRWRTSNHPKDDLPRLNW